MRGGIVVWKDILFITEIVINTLTFVVMCCTIVKLVKTQKELDRLIDEQKDVQNRTLQLFDIDSNKGEDEYV